MRIAQISPLAERVPPKGYGGTERVVSYLAEELVRQGHDVTLFASGDSVTRGRLVSVREEAERAREHTPEIMPYEVLMLERVCQLVDEFDIVHFHTDFIHFPVVRRLSCPNITTPHGRLDIPAIAPLYREFREVPLVSVSDAQRVPLPFANWQATVYHGLPSDLYTLDPKPDDYFAFIGRISPEKGIEDAIAIAKRSGVRLKIAAKIDPADEVYYEDVAKRAMQDPLVEYVGEIGDHEKQEFLGKARALLFAVNWPEPFGLAMIEAMACGTPVIARRRGSVPEVVDQGVTGFVVDSIEDAVEAANRVANLSRKRCRERFERRFTAKRMADDYLGVYRRLCREQAATTVSAAIG
ncbi:MAG: glycosyltransferase family 4 protein [Coriobacteriia bacterium]